MTPSREPGSPDALEAGCTCPIDQPDADHDQYIADPDCPLHGLHMLAAELSG
jgi:hypothetical protein